MIGFVLPRVGVVFALIFTALGFITVKICSCHIFARTSSTAASSANYKIPRPVSS